MLDNNLSNKMRLRPVAAPKDKAAGRLFLKLHIMPRLPQTNWRRWLLLGLGVIVAGVVIFLVVTS